VTLLATRLATLEIPVDPVQLYYTEDQMLLVWVNQVCEQTEAAHRAAQKKKPRA